MHPYFHEALELMEKCETALNRSLENGEITDFLMDNTNWNSATCQALRDQIIAMRRGPEETLLPE